MPDGTGNGVVISKEIKKKILIYFKGLDGGYIQSQLNRQADSENSHRDAGHSDHESQISIHPQPRSKRRFHLGAMADLPGHGMWLYCWFPFACP